MQVSCVGVWPNGHCKESERSRGPFEIGNHHEHLLLVPLPSEELEEAYPRTGNSIKLWIMFPCAPVPSVLKGDYFHTVHGQVPGGCPGNPVTVVLEQEMS